MVKIPLDDDASGPGDPSTPATPPTTPPAETGDMSPSVILMTLRLIDAGLTITQALTDAGINYREVMDAQEAAAKEGRELSQSERLSFINQAQAAVDRL